MELGLTLMTAKLHKVKSHLLIWVTFTFTKEFEGVGTNNIFFNYLFTCTNEKLD